MEQSLLPLLNKAGRLLQLPLLHHHLNLLLLHHLLLQLFLLLSPSSFSFSVRSHKLSAFREYLWADEEGRFKGTRHHIYCRLLWNDEVAHLVQIHYLSTAGFALWTIRYSPGQPTCSDQKKGDVIYVDLAGC